MSDKQKCYYWSRVLDLSRARAINPASTKEAYYSLVVKGEEDEEPTSEAKGIAVTKSTFLRLEVRVGTQYAARQHRRIPRLRFERLVSFNPNVATEQMMAPGLESLRTGGTLPVALPIKHSSKSLKSCSSNFFSKIIENLIRRHQKSSSSIHFNLNIVTILCSLYHLTIISKS